MANIIQLLPEHTANQIAAGEVVQRPASAAKELLENAIDAQATSINLIVKDAGKTLLQVTDNGCGMSAVDAKMCLERHATSKIRSSDDLFALQTMGFRGEAIASIAAISHLEIKTKTEEDETGAFLKVSGGTVEKEESCATSNGTSISVKNLFFNVPARRNFLKSEQVELRHIIEEFQRVALTNPEISFKMTHNNQEVFNLRTGSFRQRIAGIFGSKYNNRLVPVEENTDVVELKGFICKPEFARKTRGEQYFFVNNRFIKSAYLHHAVKNAFEELIPDNTYPSYFLQMSVDPAKIDVNIHPTKTEIKFEEERHIYAIIRTSVRQALGKYNIAPSLDFEQETSFSAPPLKTGQEVKMPQIQVDESFNPFENNNPKQRSFEPKFSNERIDPNWEKVYDHPEESQKIITPAWEEEEEVQQKFPVQVNERFILTAIKSGVMLIDQHRAHQRVLFEKLTLNNQPWNGQQLLFPELLELSAGDFQLISNMTEDLKHLGFDLVEFGQNTIKVNAVPAGLKENVEARGLIEELLENFKSKSGNIENNTRTEIVLSLCEKLAIPSGKQLSVEEMNGLIDELFACQSPNALPDGRKIVVTIDNKELEKKFQ